MKGFTIYLCLLSFLVSTALTQPMPVGHWTFDDGDDYFATDISGNGNDGVIWYDGVYLSTDTPSGNGYSLEFIGKLGAVHIGDPEILQIEGDITLAAWIKTGPATESWHNIIAKGHGNNGEIVLRVDGNNHPTQIWCGSYDGADHMVKSQDLTDYELDTWLHVVGTYFSEDEVWTLYFNGAWVTDYIDPVGAVSVDRPWAIGARAADYTGVYPTERHFEGLIDDVRIYDVALSEEEVLEIYNQTFSAVETQAENTPDKFSLHQNYPNPFNPHTRIEYTISKAANVNIAVFNLFGQIVTTLVDEPKMPGVHSINWNAMDQNGLEVSSGIYLVRMISGDYSQTIDVTLLK